MATDLSHVMATPRLGRSSCSSSPGDGHRPVLVVAVVAAQVMATDLSHVMATPRPVLVVAVVAAQVMATDLSCYADKKGWTAY